jgi:hypothetical protein
LDQQQQQLGLLASLNQMHPNGPNGTNFLSGQNTPQAAGNGAPNFLVGSGLINNGLATAGQNGNP